MKKFEPKDVFDRIIGEKVWDMCQLLDEKFPTGAPENIIIHQGLTGLFIRFMGMGAVIGSILTLIVSVIVFGFGRIA